MAKPQISMVKRQREQAKRERKQKKAERKEERKKENALETGPPLDMESAVMETEIDDTESPDAGDTKSPAAN